MAVRSVFPAAAGEGGGRAHHRGHWAGTSSSCSGAWAGALPGAGGQCGSAGTTHRRAAAPRRARLPWPDKIQLTSTFDDPDVYETSCWFRPRGPGIIRLRDSLPGGGDAGLGLLRGP